MHRICVFALGFSALAMVGNALGKDYPIRPIRLVVPFPPGGNVDVFARVLYRQVETELGQTFVVDNRGGANGLIGADVVAHAAPDGYTLLNTSFAFAVNPAILKEMPFDIKKDFVPVTNVALGLGYLLVVNSELPAKNIKELIELAKKRPISYSSAGVGNGQHLAGASFVQMAGIQMLHVPYKGGGPALNAVMGGEVQVHFPAASVGIPQVKQGRVRALGFTGAQRLATLPDVPTVAEAGVPGYFADAGWHGVFAPPKTPASIVKKLQVAIRNALQVPAVHKHFVDNGYEPQGDPPDVWAKKFSADVDRYAKIASAAKIERR